MRLFLWLFFSSIVSTSIAQNQLGLFAGPQMTSVSYKVQSVGQSVQSKYGFQTGVMMKVPFEGNLYFSPAVWYSYKGYKVTLNNYAYPPDVNAIDNNVSIHTLELAALIQVDLGKQPSHFFLRGGPTLDFQLIGREKFNLKTGGNVSRNMKWGPGEYGHYGATAVAQFGYESAKGFFIYGTYSQGLTNINNSDFGPQILHRVVGISFGTFLKRKKIVIDTRNRE